jgi:hypothetical protein
MRDFNTTLNKHIVDKIDDIRRLRLNVSNTDRVFMDGKLEAYLEVYRFISEEGEKNVNI